MRVGAGRCWLSGLVPARLKDLESKIRSNLPPSLVRIENFTDV